MAAHGVDFPGDDRHPMYAALAVTARPSMMGDKTPDPEHWRRLVEAVVASGERTAVVSSEFFAEADDDAIRRIIDDLGGPTVEVVVTLRPLVKIFPSQWQQYVQNGLRMGYEDWLEHMLRKPPYEQPNPSFWRRHAHDRLIERWAKAVTPDRLTVIVVDDHDREILLRSFETLLGLPSETLVPVPDAANRSLTLGETEMIRHFNIAFRDSGLPEELYSKYVRYGAVARMKTMWSPPAGGPRITTPTWAVQEATRIGAQVAERVNELGVRVVGDLRWLHETPHSDPDPGRPTPTMDPAAAAQALYGVIATAHTASAPRKTPSVQQTRSVDLMQVLARRVRRRATRAVRRRLRFR